jgi:hypothetical protein
MIIQRKPFKTNTGTRLLLDFGFISNGPMQLATSTKSERFELINVGTVNEQPLILSPVNRTETELESSLLKYLETKQSPIQKAILEPAVAQDTLPQPKTESSPPIPFLNPLLL